MFLVFFLGLIIPGQLSYSQCGAGFIETNISGSVVLVKSQTGIGNYNNITGSPDGLGAQLYDNTDVLVVDLLETIQPGDQYTITWRQRPGQSLQSYMSWDESSDGVSFYEHSLSPIDTDVESYFTLVITAESPTRVIRFRNIYSRDFEIDAVTYTTSKCITDPSCGPGYSEILLSGNATSVVAQSGIVNPQYAVGEPDGLGAELDDANDVLTIKLDYLIPAGQSYNVVWKRRNGTFTTAHLYFLESSDGVSFTEHSQSGNYTTDDQIYYISSTITAEINTYYLRFRNPSGTYGDFWIDGVVFNALSCHINPPELSASGTVQYCSVPVIAAPNLQITDPANQTIDRMYVYFSDNFESGEDVLSCTDGSGITSSYDATYGILTLTGSATTSSYETVLGTVMYSNSSGTPVESTREITIAFELYNPVTGHYYKYVSNPGITWTQANIEASASDYYGQEGYLATITSQEENDFLSSQLAGASWIGANDVAVEGQWRWVTGPENGTLFWVGDAGGTEITYANWRGGEPNNSGDEDYAHIADPSLTPIGSWNDLPDAGGGGVYETQGYFIEYGGMPGDPVLSLSATVFVKVGDDEDPVTTCLVSGVQNVTNDPGDCTYTHSGTGWNATATDNCTVSSIVYQLSGVTTGTGTNLNGVVFNSGTTTVTWTATDGSGNTGQCSFDVTVTDNEDPTFTPSSDLSANTSDDDTGDCNVAIAVPAFVFDDNCPSPSLSWSMTGATIASDVNQIGTYQFNKGTTTVTYTVTDAATRSVTDEFDVVVTDDEDPAINCVANPQNRNTDTDECTYTTIGTEFNPTLFSDNCPGSTISNNLTGTSSLAGYVFSEGTTNVIWTVTDAVGHTATCNFNVVITDTQDPTITCSGAQTQTADAGVCNAAVTVTGPATGDNCGVASVINDYTGTANASGTYPVGTTTVTWTVTDIHGNTNTCTQNITVTDDEDPTITCSGAQTQTADAGVCNAAVTVTGPATGDNCGVASVINDYTGTANASGTYPVGTTTVTWTVTDIHGNTNTCTQNITVTDDEDPTITCSGAQTQTADAGVCNAAVTVTGPATGDNCGVASVINDYTGTANASGTYPVGTTTVTWTVTDIHGNTNTCTQNITVTDDEDPTITCSGAQTQTADAGVCNAAVTVTGPATGDNCGVASVINDYTGTANASGTYPVGTTTVTWTVTDIHGNTNTCTQNITVTDDEDPTITCSGAQSQTADAGVCNAAVTVTGPATGDNCGVASVINDYTGTANASGTYPVGTTTVTWTVTDIHGNTNTCTQNITVTDDEDPTITCSGAQSQTADAGVCNAAVTVTGPATGDNCGVASVINDYTGTANASGTYPVGTTTVTWTVTDIHGNTNTCTQNITVTDDEDPTITCSGAQSQTADAGVCNAAVTVTGPATGDNCGVASVINIINNNI